MKWMRQNPVNATAHRLRERLIAISRHVRHARRLTWANQPLAPLELEAHLDAIDDQVQEAIVDTETLVEGNRTDKR